MNRDCDLVRDLLPLYVEDMVSESSRNLVKKHLAECDCCRAECNEIKSDLVLPRNVDTASLKRLRKTTRKQIRAAILAVVSAVVLLLNALFVLYHIPVWLPADEAIMSVNVTDSGILEIMPTQWVYGMYEIGNGELFMGLRLLPGSRQMMLESVERTPFQTSVDGIEGFWYAGELIGEENVLLYGEGSFVLTQWDEEYMDWSMEYLFWGSLLLGAVLVLMSLFMRRKRGGAILWRSGLLPLFFAGACWFVTNGAFLTLTGLTDRLITSSGLWIRVIASGTLAVLAWCLVLSVTYLVKRRGQNGIEL